MSTFFRIICAITFVLAVNEGFAQISSKASGAWNNPNTWSCTCVPGATDVVTVEHAVTSASSVSVLELKFSTEWSPSFGHGQLNITAGTFSVAQGTVSFGNNGQSTHSLTIAEGATFDASGADMQWLQGAAVNVSGTLRANNFDVANGQGGNFSVASTGNVVFGGTIGITSGPHSFNIDGDFQTGGITISGNNTINITGNGDVNVTGNVSATSSGIINVDGGNMDVSGNIHTDGDANINTTNGGTVNAGSCSGACDSDADINVSLPVSLISFEGHEDISHVVLKWQTASELNNDFFTLDKSINGRDFFPIANVDGAGDSKVHLKYSFLDLKSNQSGLVYYRLSQTDFDGTHVLLKVITIGNGEATHSVKLVPNIAESNTILSAEGATADMTWKVYSLSGSLEQCGSFIGGNQLRLNNLTKGAYLLQVSGQSGVSTEKFIVR
ncbi:MAG: T9SS type A sorting domain-containing protein [Marinoscillum sp.]